MSSLASQFQTRKQQHCAEVAPHIVGKIAKVIIVRGVFIAILHPGELKPATAMIFIVAAELALRVVLVVLIVSKLIWFHFAECECKNIAHNF
jgi:hypothetical protein